jgi:hypothetical protein
VVTAAIYMVFAQAALRDARVRAERVELPPWPAHRILDCDDIGLCPNEDWLIFPGNAPRALARLEQRGCHVRKVLQGETSIGCPKGLAVSGARVDRIFRAEDLAASEHIGASELWERGILGAGVRVAVLDTGVNATHPELASNVAQLVSFTAGDGDDLHGHGTHVAGIVASQGAEDPQSRGVAPEAELLIAQVCSEQGLCLESDVLAGLEWALGRGAMVINLSLGGGMFGDHCDADPLAAAVNGVVASGAVVVVSAGNSGQGVGNPACASRAIAVGAVDANDVRAPFSSVGSALDLMAPGVSILSTYTAPAYQRLTGTSMAAPHVAGAAALILGMNPGLDSTGVSALLTSTANDLGTPGFDTETGHGLVDVAAALAELQATMDEDGDSYPLADDCDDRNAAVHPGALEICNDVDDNCDGSVDEGFDADADGVTSCSGDCMDSDPAIRPGATELCNGLDEDCNNVVDDGFDADADGATTCAGDCNDSSALVHPGASEICNGADDNCNGKMDEDCTFDGICGDGVCLGSENAESCPGDCPEGASEEELGHGWESPGSEGEGEEGEKEEEEQWGGWEEHRPTELPEHASPRARERRPVAPPSQSGGGNVPTKRPFGDDASRGFLKKAEKMWRMLFFEEEE